MSDIQLAIHGAEPAFPMGPPPWPVANERIMDSVKIAMENDCWGKYDSSIGDQLVIALQSQFSVEYAMPCSSGTIAVELALRGVGVKPDDEVLLAAYDFPGNFRAIEAIGARPVLVDVCQDGWLMDLDKIASAVSEQTRAILVSHLHGHLVGMTKLQSIASHFGLKIVEDACQSPGALQDGLPLGSFGDVGVLSFGGSKLLSAGRGGAILTNDPGILQRAKIFANRGNDAFPLSQLQAAALLPQIEGLNKVAAKRHAGAKRLCQLLADSKSGIMSPDDFGAKEPGERAAPYKVPLLIAAPLRKPFLECLAAEGIAAGEGFRGFASRTERRCRKPMELMNSKRAATESVLLHHPVLLESDSYLEKLSATLLKVDQYVRETFQ